MSELSLLVVDILQSAALITVLGKSAHNWFDDVLEIVRQMYMVFNINTITRSGADWDGTIVGC